MGSPPSSLQQKDPSGCLPAHVLCSQRCASLDEVKFLVEQHLESAREATEEGLFPIHCACKCEAPLEIIQYLFDVHREAFHAKSHIGDKTSEFLPFHSLCPGSSYDKVALMLEYDAELVKQASGERNLPLHLLCANSKCTLEIIAAIHGRYPEAASQRNKSGMAAGDVDVDAEMVDYLQGLVPCPIC